MSFRKKEKISRGECGRNYIAVNDQVAGSNPAGSNKSSVFRKSGFRFSERKRDTTMWARSSVAEQERFVKNLSPRLTIAEMEETQQNARLDQKMRSRLMVGYVTLTDGIEVRILGAQPTNEVKRL